MNKVMLIGNLTRDPELNTTSSGVSVCNFSIAINRRFQNADGVREVDYINIVAWRNVADLVNRFLTKGSKCAVIGSLQTRSYDAADGTKRYVTEVLADEVEFLGSRNDSNSYNNNNDSDNGSDGLNPIDDDTLPF